MSNALKNAYLNIIMPYESYLAKHKPTASTTANATGTTAGVKREASSDSSMDVSQGSLATPAASPPSHHDTPAPPTRRSKRIKKELTSYTGKSLLWGHEEEPGRMLISASTKRSRIQLSRAVSFLLVHSSCIL